jgi:2',3'-cyclic-nucleotide 2'-phosphodiesterase (5'-nucleotidase family)
VDAGGFSKGYGQTAELQTDFLLKGMSMLKYDVVNLAAKDFANGGEFLHQAGKKHNNNFISANVVYSEDQKQFVEPYFIKKMSANNSISRAPFDKLTVGFFGVCDQKDPLLHRNSTETPLKSLNPVEVAKEVVPQVRKKADLVVMVFNGRYKTLEAILDNIDGIDIVIMGGEYYRAEQYSSKDIVIASTPSLGKYFGVLSIELDKNKRIVSSNKRSIPLDTKIDDDPRFTKLVQDFEKAKKEYAAVPNEK